MNRSEVQFLRDETGGAQPRHMVSTGTRIDTGRWWQKSRLWLCVMDKELVLLAVGRRQFLERIAIADCPATHYNNATGELVLEPAEALRFPRLRMSPSDALYILELLEPQPATPNQHA